MIPQTHRLFFALLPDASVGADIARVASKLKTDKLVSGSWIHPSKHHMTLHWLGDYSVVPTDLIERAKLAAATVAAKPFQLLLDSVSSFRGRRPPCVLRVAQGFDATLQEFWLALRAALVMEGLHANLEKDFTPHVTLAYGDKLLTKPVRIAQIVWPVDQFFLIHNVVGPTPYRKLGPWPLSD